MQTYRIRLQVHTALGTPIVGDTLFGQMCWTLLHQHGEAKLEELLQDYCNEKPFCVVSDAFPQGYLPLPVLPSTFWAQSTDADRKQLKKKRWLAIDQLMLATARWQAAAISDAQLSEETGGENSVFSVQRAQSHNTIDRQTGTTGTGQFAPYQTEQIWYAPNQVFDVYVVLDETRLSVEELSRALSQIGSTGYGRDASIGLGKFSVLSIQAHEWQTHASVQTRSQHQWLTLAACCPQGLGFDSAKSFYHVTTKFGRHGDTAALSGNPFKQPLMMARTAAVFSKLDETSTTRLFIGQGIANISLSQSKAVHQALSR